MRAVVPILILFLACVPCGLGDDHAVKGTEVPVKLRGASASMLSSVDEVVAAQLDLSADTEPSAALADDLAFFVRRHYLAQGYLKAHVEWALEAGSIVLLVEEGVQQHVGKVTFEGNPGLDVAEMRRYLLRPTRERVGRFAKTLPYVEKEVAGGMDLVHRYILSQGYVDAEVEAPVAANHEDGTTDLNMVIRPGEQWHVGAVELEGEPALLSGLLRFEARALEDQVVNEAHIENARRQMEGEVQARGYFAAKVSTTTTRAANKHLDVTFKVVPGPLHKVTSVEIDPAFSKGAARLLGSGFRPLTGHVYDSPRAELAYKHLIDTGIFEHLEMEPKVVGEGELALAFRGQEAKRYSIGLSGGYDTFLGAMLGVEYKDVNFFDTGGTFSTKVLGTQLGLQAEVQWKDPALFNSPYALALDVKPETFTFDGYTRHTLGVRAAVSRDFTKHLSMELYVGTSVSTVTSPTLTPLEVGPESYTLGTAGMTLIYEARDNPVSPTRGWFASATVEDGYVAGSSMQINYIRTDFAASYYQPITNKWRSAIGAHFGSLISGAPVEDIPIELREYNGGAKGVRSFAERALGPRAPQDGTPLGGTQFETFSGEISYEIVKNLEVAGFMDVGSLTTDKASILPRFNDLRYAAGMGLRYRLPFGPLRIDYGVNLDKRPGESSGALHIGFGFAF